MVDEEQDTCSTFYDTSDQANPPVAAPTAASTGGSLASKFCPKCFLFWVVILAVVIGAIWYAKKNG
jgi:hypothetical protein